MRILLAVLLALSFAAPSRADGPAAPPVATNPFTATVPVADTTDAQRDVALSTALAQVLGQIAPDARAGPDVLAQAPGLVRTFHYQRAAGGNGLELEVNFDAGSVRRLAQQLGAPAAAADAASAQPGTAAQATGQGDSGTLWIGGIGDSQDFVDMLATLRQAQPLHNVTLLAAKGDGVLVRADCDVPLADVPAALAGGGHLAAAAPHPGADVSLRWVH